ncbi:hypothetical protein J6590_022619 [Homalodisca vitripennis]|nr:hypothetical protein J6590_022619 [Homalodisca vitripennis]
MRKPFQSIYKLKLISSEIESVGRLHRYRGLSIIGPLTFALILTCCVSSIIACLDDTGQTTSVICGQVRRFSWHASDSAIDLPWHGSASRGLLLGGYCCSPTTAHSGVHMHKLSVTPKGYSLVPALPAIE